MKMMFLTEPECNVALTTVHRPPVLYLYFSGLSASTAAGMSHTFSGFLPVDFTDPIGTEGLSGLANRSGKLEGAFPIGKPAIQLGLFHSEQDFLKTGARLNPHALQVISGYQPWRAYLLRRGFFQKLPDELVNIQSWM